MGKNDVVTVVAISGEYVGRFISNNGGVITLKDPRMLVQNEQGMGFANGVAVTGKPEPTLINFHSYVFATATSETVEKAYVEAVSGLVL